MVRPMEDETSSISSQFEEPGSLNALLPQLEQALESAMSAASGGPGGPSLSPGKPYSAAGAAGAAGAGARPGRAGRPWGRNRQHVLARLEVVRGVPFYGYHGREKLFVKVRMNWLSHTYGAVRVTCTVGPFACTSRGAVRVI